MKLSFPAAPKTATLVLPGSKSLSNRALIALALAGASSDDYLERLSNAKDTQILYNCLRQPVTDTIYDAGDAGTAFRFLTAYLAIQPGQQLLTGSPRMLQRPIGALVNALRELGAHIEYLENEGFPPLRLGEWNPTHRQAPLRVRADVSSQFLSALLLVGPYMPGGLQLVPDGQLVSKPYIDMTLGLMRYFGADAEWQDDSIRVAPGGYTPKPLAVEPDWSNASYWYALVALSDSASLNLPGLRLNSLQGDRLLADTMQAFNVYTEEMPDGLRIEKRPGQLPANWEFDFTACPDLAQTLAVVCAALGVEARFAGLQTLVIKETDRIDALKTELYKVGVRFDPVVAGREYRLYGKANLTQPVRFATYGDHRMAMAFSVLSVLGPMELEAPEVVVKSYPHFWDDFQAVGGLIQPGRQ